MQQGRWRRVSGGREPSGGWAYGWAACWWGARALWWRDLWAVLLLLLLLLLLLGLCAGGGGAVGRGRGRHLAHRDHAQQECVGVGVRPTGGGWACGRSPPPPPPLLRAVRPWRGDGRGHRWCFVTGGTSLVVLTCSVVLMCSKIGSGVLLWALLWLGSKSPSTPAVGAEVKLEPKGRRKQKQTHPRPRTRSNLFLSPLPRQQPTVLLSLA